MGTLLEMWKQSIQLPGLYTFDEAQAACPPGYRLPIEKEQNWLLANTDFSFDKKKKEGVFRFADGDELRLPAAGDRFSYNDFYDQGACGFYWSSTPCVTSVWFLHFNNSTATVGVSGQGNALSVRCVPINVSTKGKPLDGMLNQTDNLDDRMRQIFIRNGVPILDLNQLSDEDLQEWLSLKKQSSELVNRIRKLINKR